MDASNADARLAAALVGSWQLVRWTIEYPGTDRVTEPFGPRPEGLLLYTADGYMSAALQKRDRPCLSRIDVYAVTDAEKAAAFGSYLNYAGRWHVADGCVIHEVECSMNPNLIGTRQVRRAALAGSTLELTAQELLEDAGRVRVHRIEWRRATPPA